MRTRKLFIILAVLIDHQLFAQGINKITGPLGAFHIVAGYSYSDSTGTDTVPMEYEFKFGELIIPNQEFDLSMNFQQELDSCAQWNANRIFGVLQPPTEHGIYNQPADTALYLPYPQVNYPGEIQGGQRFSRLSKLYSGYCGVILDDWNGDTSIVHQVHDAVQGKYVDANGNVCYDCIATTPYNKLYCVIYSTYAVPTAMPFIDGVSYWYHAGQDCCYDVMDNDITQLAINFPHKEIMIGIYLRNSALGWTDPVSVQYMLQHALDRYDDGDINEVTIATAYDLTTNNITAGLYDSFALSYWLDSLYFPYLGEGQGKLYDCKTGDALTGASVRVFCEARVSGDTLLRGRKLTDAGGQYQFGLWAGNRITDSTYYRIIAEKTGYVTDTAGFWIKRGDTTNIPDLSLCPAKYSGISGADNLLIFPNPTNGKCTIQMNTGQATSELEIYNMLGKKVYSTTQASTYLNVDLSSQSDGVYLVFLRPTQPGTTQKQLLLLAH